MRPAFSSTKQAAAFALLLLVVLLSPVLAGKRFLPPREQAYTVQSWGCGPFPWLEDQIFRETNDIDIAFLGSSHMVKGIDTPYVQDQLTARLGRPAVVRTIAWGGPGFDGLYLIAKDLLEHRKVKLLVFYDEKVQNLRPAALVSLFRFGDNPALLASLPSRDQGLYYGTALFGLPRNLLGLIRFDIPAALHASDPAYIPPRDNMFGNAPEHLGAVPVDLGFNPNPMFADNEPFVRFRPAVPGGVKPIIYSSSEATNFAFGGESLPPWQIHFAKQFAMQCRIHGCKMVMLAIPTARDTDLPIIPERVFWPDLFQSDVAMVGVPTRSLFRGMNNGQLNGLFSDVEHLNSNGMSYFTSVITPALLNLYEIYTAR